jgi:hypothetical protein
MRLADKVQEWLDEMEWKETVDRNEETQTSQLNCIFTINDQGFDLYIETDEQNDFLKVFLYAPFKALANKYDDCIQLFNRINGRRRFGAVCLQDNGRIQYRHTIDVENADLSTIMITNILNEGRSQLEQWFEEISAVALTKKTAQEIFDELDNTSEVDDAPDSI